MGEKFIPGGPKRYRHQKRGLKKMIETGGVCALLFDPGTGKTGTTLDYCSLLAIKSPEDQHGVREVRVLVAAPLAAVDSWVAQAPTFISPQTSYWAEALGGTLEQRAEALAARGGRPYKKDSTGPREPWTAPRAVHVRRSLAVSYQDRTWTSDWEEQEGGPENGPDQLNAEMPRLVLVAVNLDAFSSRTQYRSTTMADRMLDAVKRFSPDLVIVDESHKIKGAGSNVSRLMSRIGATVDRRIILTGTVMPKGPMDVFGQWRFLEPYAFGMPQPDGTTKPSTFTSFKERYAQMGGFMGREVVGFQNLDEMQDIMAKNSIVARKEDALDLPKTSDVTLTVHLSSAEAKAYLDMKKTLAVEYPDGSETTTDSVLAKMMRLRQITSGFLPTDEGEMKVLGTSKADAINSLVNDTLAGEERIVIFCHFRAEVALLAEKMAATAKRNGQDLTIEEITGATDKKERIRIRERFGSDKPGRRVLIAQIKTLSLAVNELVTANHAIFGSMSQQRDDYIQARDRLNRIGQKRPVTFWHAVVPGTLDGVIIQSHQDGTSLESAVLSHIHSENVPG